MGKEKFYVVWKGVTPGVYTRWTDCQLQTKGFEGAIYKSFDTDEEARKAFLSSPYEYFKKSTDASKKKSQPGTIPPSVAENSLAVDAACSGNPGMQSNLALASMTYWIVNGLTSLFILFIILGVARLLFMIRISLTTPVRKGIITAEEAK